MKEMNSGRKSIDNVKKMIYKSDILITHYLMT